MRGGSEGVYRFKFETLGKWTHLQIAYHLSKKGWEINHLSTKPLRKLIWRIHYLNLPKKDSNGVQIDTSRLGI